MIKSGSSKSGLENVPDGELVSEILGTSKPEKRRVLQEELYRRYAGKIYHKCLSLVKNPEAAKDLTHDIFIKIFLNLSAYKAKAPFYSWVFAITYNSSFDYLKERKKMYTMELSELSVELVDDDHDLQLKLFKEANLEALEKAFKLLREPERILLTMFYQDKMAIKEIAEVLGSGESAVKMRLKRSRDHLAELIKKMVL